DGAGGDADGVEAGAAQAVDGGGGDFHGQARQQHGHAGDVAVVFAGLVGAAVDQVVDLGPVDVRIARHQCLDRQRREVVGANAGERSAVAAEGGADGVAEKGGLHGGARRSWVGVAACSASSRRVEGGAA